jgi:hypothetical protein
LWSTNFVPAQRLLKQIIPAGLLRALQSSEKVHLLDEAKAELDRDNLKIAQGAQVEISKVEIQLLEVERAVVKQTKALMLHWRGMKNREQIMEKEVQAPKLGFELGEFRFFMITSKFQI